MGLLRVGGKGGMTQWFGPRTSCIGVMPCSWHGWFATAILVAVLIGSRFNGIFVAIILFAFFGVVKATYEDD